MSKVKKERKKERVYGFLDPLCFYLEIQNVYICITSVTYNTPQPHKKKGGDKTNQCPVL